MTKRMHCAWTGALLLMGSLGVWAQRTPAPAASSGPISAIGAEGADASQAPAGTEQQQETSDLSASGVKLPTLGGMPQLLTYGFRVMQVASTNTSQVGGGNTVQSITMFSGTTALNRSWGRSRLNLNYNGAESVFAGGGLDTQLTSSHQLNLSTILTKRRWSLALTEAASYTPQSSFGLGIYGGLGSNPLGFGSDLRSGLYPNESVLNAGRRFDDSTIAELTYSLSPRNSLRGSAGFGILRFQDSGFSNNSQYNLGFGFSRVLSRRSSFSLDYQFWRTESAGFSEVQAHSALLGYTRQISPRLTVEISGGPQLQVQKSTASSNSLQWTSSNTLLYRMERSSLSLTYSAGIAGGSGVYQASRNHLLRAALSRPVTRYWVGTLDFGYAQNSGVGALSKSRAEQGGFLLGRQVAGKGLTFSYQFQHQSLGGICSGADCSVFGGWSHTVGIGLDWIARPLRIG